MLFTNEIKYIYLARKAKFSIVLIISILLISNLLSQSDSSLFESINFGDKITDVLLSIDSIEIYQSKEEGVIYRKGIFDSHRSITDSIIEHVIEIQKNKRGEPKGIFNYVNTYSICILSYGERVSQALVLLDRNIKETDETWKLVRGTLIIYENTDLLLITEAEFYSDYDAKIFYRDLYNKEIFYGFDCWLYENEDAPVSRADIDKLGDLRDTNKIVTYLQSPNIEKQLFGLEGILLLEKKGYQVSTQTTSLIEKLKNRNSFVRYCRSHVIREMPSRYVIFKLEKWLMSN